MAKVVEYRDIPLDDLVIGKGQVRTQSPGKEVEELAASIETQGLLQPVGVCAAKQPGKWELLTGQRRFLAHKYLKRNVISTAILDERVDEGQAKAISITENLIRRQLSGRELKDGILYLHKLYGSVKDVVEATGLPRTKVQNYVKYPRLLPELKEMVDDQVVDVNAALKAQDASSDEAGKLNPEIAVKLAQEMTPMSDVQRRKLVKEHRDHPDRSIDEVIEHAKSGAKVTQITVTLTQSTHAALREFSKEEGTNQDEAAATLIDEALVGRGLLEE